MQNEQATLLDRCQRDPAFFFEKILGVDTLEDYQRRILETVRDNERTAISACHDVGKSWTMARVVLWYATCFPYSKIITTAPTFNQVKNILWSEIRSAHARSKYPLGGKMNLTDWHLSQHGDWFAIGFTPRNELTGGEGQGTQSSFQGFHAPHILVVFDEATGIPHNTWTMAEGLLTSANVKFVAIGNPTSRNSEFFRCFKSPAWAKVKLSCFDSPNLRANGITTLEELAAEVARVRAMTDNEAQAHMRSYKAPKPYLLTLKWVVAMALQWGMEHPLFISKVLGAFPEDGDNTLIPLGAVEDAQMRFYTPREGDRKTLGVDVARFGSDSTVITAMHGKQSLFKRMMNKRDTVEVTGEVIACANEMGGVDVIVVDETGLGAGVVDNLNEAVRERRLKCEVRGVQFGAAPECSGPRECDHRDASLCDKAKFANLKARMYALLAADIKASDGLTVLPDAIYLEELPTVLYSFDSKGRMVIESKEDYKKRTGRGSPDHADSFALANFGRHDEISAGKLDKSYTDFKPPLAASLGMTKSW